MNPSAGKTARPRVSVLLPNRNHEAFLAEAIDSVLQQDFKDFEFLISDNASTDGSTGVIRRYLTRHPWIQFTAQPTDLGLAGNLNWCLSQAKGEYVKFLFADDKFTSPTALGKLVAMLDRADDIVLASCSSPLLNRQSEVTFVRHFLPADTIERGGDACRRSLLKGSNEIGEPSLVLFRKRCAGAGFDLTYRFWIDVECWLRVLEQGRFAYTTEPLAAFRQHSQQVSQQCVQEGLGHLEFHRLLVQYADRPWLGRQTARDRLFEERYRSRKRNDPPTVRESLTQSLQKLGGPGGYATFRCRRAIQRPLAKLLRWFNGVRRRVR